MRRGALETSPSAAMTPRTIVRRDEAVSPPADGSKPCPRADNRRRARHWRDGFPPPVEPRRRRAGIQSAFSRGVLLTISQDIDQRKPDRARRGQRPRVIAVPEDGSAPPERAVHRTREADHETAQAVPQRMGVVGLDDEMEMVILRAEMDHAKPRWEAAPSALRTAGKTRAARRQRTTGPQRSVTCTGHEAMCAGRVQCGTPGRRPGVGFRPAPRRRPPQVRGDGSDSCKERATLIQR